VGTRRWRLVTLVVAAQALGVAVTTPAAPLPAWSELSLTAHKFSARAAITVRASVVTARDVAPLLLRTAAATVVRPIGAELLLLESTATFEGRVFDERLWVDPLTGAGLQITDTETGSKNLYRAFRLLTRGFLVEQREPATPGEAALSPERWTAVERAASSYPPSVSPGTVVTGALNVLCSPQLTRLSREGDSTSFVILAQRQIEQVTVTVEKATTVLVDFVEVRSNTTRHIGGEVAALVLTMVSHPLEPETSPSFRLFGLEHGLTVLWEPTRRIPLELSGRIHLLGEVTVTLERVKTD